MLKGVLVVINRKTTKFESNSQQRKALKNTKKSCYQSQNYKIWKQFTTATTKKKFDKKLLSIAKLQNLKAIHNDNISNKNDNSVVINRKTTKFESNSQPEWLALQNALRCYQSQNYKIWKQFTT